MRVSVVINTFNRAKSLEQTLKSLQYQTCDAFEVVVVNGPSTDDTDAVLSRFAGQIRTAVCPEVHIAKSRNVGIAAADGDIVAFIDDDAIPEPCWLSDLLAAYDDDKVGGAGGIVYDYTGFQLQYRHSVCSRIATTSLDVTPPYDHYTKPGADPFLGLLGTNASFRRDCLVRIGGFDEEIEYFLDETEVCMRVIDLGYTIRPLPNAAVHHKFLPSHRRSVTKKLLDPFAYLKNTFYFALQNGRGTRSLSEILQHLFALVEERKTDVHSEFLAGRYTAAQYEFFLRQVDRAVEVGIVRGLHQPRRRQVIPPADGSRFRPFPVLYPPEKRLKICFLGQQYQSVDSGGAIDTGDLATRCAARGHEVHVITESPDHNRVDFEDGVWVRRLAPDGRSKAALAAAVYHEVCRVQDRGTIDVVVGAVGPFESVLSSLDGRFSMVLTPFTSGATIEDALKLFNTAAASHRGMAVVSPAQRQKKQVEELAKMLVETAAISRWRARRQAVRLLTPTPLPEPATGHLSRFDQLRACAKSIPLFDHVARYIKRLVCLPWSFHKFQTTFKEVQQSLHMSLHEQHRELRALIDEQNNEMRHVVSHEMEALRALIREQGRSGHDSSQSIGDQREAA